MRLSFFLAVFMMLFTATACSQEKKQEYNVGSCAYSSFTIEHMEMDKQLNKLSFTYFMPEPNQVEKTDSPMVLSYKETKQDKDVSSFEAEEKVTDPADKKSYDFLVRGVLYKDRVVAVLTIDGQLVRIYYGTLGSTNDMVKLVDNYLNMCHTIRGMDSQDFLLYLEDWLKNQPSDSQVN